MGELYGRLVAAKGGSTAFSAVAIADLCNDLGFVGDVERAHEALRDVAAVATGATVLLPVSGVAPSAATAAAVAATPAGAGTPSGGPPVARPHLHQSVPLSQAEFADIIAAAAAAAQVDDSRVPDYVAVFHMLHMSGIRERAGVAATGAAAGATATTSGGSGSRGDGGALR